MKIFKKKQLSLKWAPLSVLASEPVRATKGSAGYDLRSANNYTIPPKSRMAVLTDVQLTLPKNTYGRIAARSGLSLNYSIDVGAGVIDADYDGNVTILLINNGNDPFVVRLYDRVAQLILERNVTPKTKKINVVSNESAFVHSGFGSTGF